MKAKEIHYDANDDTITASGGVLIKVDQYLLKARTIHYDIKKDIVFAAGNIRIVDEFGKTIYGEKAVFKDKFKQGIIKEFVAKLGNNSIVASRVALRMDKNKFALEKSVFTACELNCGKNPIWQVKAKETDIDYDKQKITYKHTFFEVYGIPLVYIPYFSHPTPNAEAQSGVLGPKIKQNSLLIPFYFRAKPNLDFTISPRFAKNHTIFEAELRHKLKNGQYNILGSYGNPSQVKTDNNGLSKGSRPGRYHIFSKGDFSENEINFGFDFRRTSDKAYLTNYHQVYDSYLPSQIYVNTIDGSNYFSLESFYFQDLRITDTKSDLPFVFPYIRTHHVIGLNDDESVLLNVRNNTIAYRDSNDLQLARTALDLELMTNLVSDNGHMVTYSLANRGDLYWVNFFDKEAKLEQQKVWYRNIPEVSSRWRYPLITSLGTKTSLKLEPTAMIVLGRKYESRFNKFGLIDSNKTELSENNLFNTNRFSGVDFHDYGSRISYGVNSVLASEHLYLDTFLGQLLHRNNVSERGNSEYVGSATVNFASDFELFYRFRRDKKLKPIRNEIGAASATEDFNATASFTELRSVPTYFARDDFKPEKNKISQLGFNLKYQLIKNLWVGGGAKLDISSKKTKFLIRSIEMTYLFDCVSIDGTITDNFLQDNLRGIKKERSYSFAIGLKVINM
ncbi:MAG: LPS-assembly protein LptD [Rickettsiaceae bacterium]